MMNAGPYLLSDVATSAAPSVERELLTLADASLDLPPVSVMDKDRVPPSGDRHDWMNLADYFWPNPDSASGMPYVEYDGRANPEAGLYDRRRFNLLVLSVLRLGAAWKATNQTRYAAKATELLRHWFLHAETAMNPHLRFAHHVPGGTPGHSAGLIVFCTALPSLLDVWLAIRRAGLIEEQTHTAMCAWANAFLHWLLTDPMSIEHGRAENNHGTFHDYLLAYLMLFLDRLDDARDLLSSALRLRLSTQINATGEQPQETRRTLSAQYSLANLKALMSLATLAEAAELDGWRRDAGQPPILRATEFLYRHATGDAPWPYPQLEPPNWWFLTPLCLVANRSYDQAFDVSRIPMAVSDGAVPMEPVVFMPGWELVYAPSHRQHLPTSRGKQNRVAGD